MIKLRKVMCGILFMLFLLPQNAFANGGPGEGYALLSGGNIKFENTPDILVEKENLHIVLSPRTSVVTAEYTLINTGAARELSYIFPITQYVSENYVEGYVAWISFYDGEKKLTYTKTENQVPEKEDKTDGQYHSYSEKTTTVGDEEINYNYIKNAYYNTNLSFAAGETKKLTVSYKASNSFESGGTSKSLLSSFSDVRFLYDLSPAAAWGNGKAGEFNLSIDYNELYHVADLAVNMDGFSRHPSGVYYYTAKNFDFAKQGLISAVFYYPFELEELQYYQKDSDWLSSIYISSTLKSQTDAYSALNLFDGNPDTVWASDGKGVGETIELFFDNGASVGILNGFIKNEALYYDNARIKKLKVETWVFDSATKGFVYPLEYEVEFDDIPYAEIDKSNLLQNITLFATGDSSKEFMRLTVLEVYPGRKFKDLCVSEMFLFSQNEPYEYPEEGFAFSAISIYDNFAEILKETHATLPTEDTTSNSQPSSSPTTSETPNPSDTGAPPASTSPQNTEHLNSEQIETEGFPAKYALPIVFAILLLVAFGAGVAVYIQKKKKRHE